MWSIWEKESFGHFEHIIIGGGIVGLSTAIALKALDKTAKVLVLERGLLPTGASTKNAGFACFGSLSELCTDIEALGENEAFHLVKERWSGLGILRKRLGDMNIGFKNWGGYELIRPQELHYLRQIPEINAWLAPLFGKKVFEARPDLIKSFGFEEQALVSIIHNPFEGQIDTGKMMSCLWDQASRSGVKMITGAEVCQLEELGHGAVVKVLHQGQATPLTFTADKLTVCTNAFSQALIPDLALRPGRGIVLATKPLDPLPFQGTFHYDEGYYYFRNYGQRVLFGGGRNIDFEAEESTDFDINPKIMDQLRQQLSQLILPGKAYEIEQAWAGIMAFGSNKKPILAWHSDHILVATRLGGMGVAIGSHLGERAAKTLIQGKL